MWVLFDDEFAKGSPRFTGFAYRGLFFCCGADLILLGRSRGAPTAFCSDSELELTVSYERDEPATGVDLTGVVEMCTETGRNGCT